MRDRIARLIAITRHNGALKALSLLMATISWFIIQDAISFEVVIPDVRLQVLAQEGLATLNQSVSTVDVTFRGSQEDIQRLDPRRIQAVVELNRTGGMPSEINLTPDIIHGVRGARAVAVHPTRLHVTLDRQEEKRVPVKGRLTGEPLFGEVESVTCEPSTVLLRGPAAKLRTTDGVYTQPVDVDGRVESFVRRSAVQAPGDNWVAQIEPADVQVKVTLAARSGGKEWKSVPVHGIVDLGRPVTIDIEPPVVDVMVRGRSNDLAVLEQVPLRAVVDCAGLQAPGTYTLPVRVFPTFGGAPAATRPEMVRVTVK